MSSGSDAAILAKAPTRANPYENPRSVEFGFRAKRFSHIRSMIEAVLAEKGHCEILDLGGTETYWRIGGDFLKRNRNRLSITLVNPEKADIADRQLFTSVVGDATANDLFAGRSFDLVHSNSVVEHVGGWDDMKRFAANTRRLAPRYYMQTPNYWFPYEPHFRFVGFQYLPAQLRTLMLRKMSLGFFSPVPDADEARGIIDHHQLISERQFRNLLPDAEIIPEKILGMKKSLIALRR